jgi:hypothetical protein
MSELTSSPTMSDKSVPPVAPRAGRPWGMDNAPQSSTETRRIASVLAGVRQVP